HAVYGASTDSELHRTPPSAAEGQQPCGKRVSRETALRKDFVAPEEEGRGRAASRIIVFPHHELPGSGAQIPPAEVLRSHRAGPRDPHPEKRPGAGADG